MSFSPALKSQGSHVVQDRKGRLEDNMSTATRESPKLGSNLAHNWAATSKKCLHWKARANQILARLGGLHLTSRILRTCTRCLAIPRPAPLHAATKAWPQESVFPYSGRFKKGEQKQGNSPFGDSTVSLHIAGPATALSRICCIPPLVVRQEKGT